MGCKWIFNKKYRIRFKARLVAKGFTQRQGIDFNEVFSLTVKHSYIRVLLALVSLYDLELEQLDVNVSFLYGDLEERIYMQQPKGVHCARKTRPCVFVEKVFLRVEEVTQAMV